MKEFISILNIIFYTFGVFGLYHYEITKLCVLCKENLK